jgi:superfamily II DNA or RNA helicase
MTSFEVGSLVSARGREWVVLPETEPDLLVLRPLGGTEDEVTGIYIGKGESGEPFERVTSASFPLPDPEKDLGNHLSGSLLRDAVRLGFRSAAGPFRSLARIAVEPRPYQLVPLLMALKLEPVRMLIADDVGIGKTVEACLIARELYDRGEVQRFAVLCPPHLAEQWQRALRDQFHIDAALVLSGTASRLERDCPPGQSLFDRHPFTVVSTDYIKQERRRAEFLRTAPELVLVDEAHTCAAAGGARSASQQRHALLQDLVKDETRHLLLITATPHSGNPETFRSLLGLLQPDFANLPEDLGGEVHRKQREALARHLVQRRRGDILAYQGATTSFPKRVSAEAHYTLRPEYRRFFDKILAYCRETVQDTSQDQRRQRVRWWSALALLRSISSSPAAAAATLRNRSAAAGGESVKEVDEEGRRAVLDIDDESAEGLDVVAGAGDDEDEASAERRRLRDLAREADALAGPGDAKLTRVAEIILGLVAEGSQPIVFCRFIHTAEYVADALRKKLPKDVTVEAVTGLLPPDERENRIEGLGKHAKRVLVCTDCLSEGINLQHLFDTVVHYDLAWNPTRHEQREGRVDRYGQERETVRALTYYGSDNPVDGIVLDVLLRKHKSIRDQLGVAVPVPMDTAVVEELLREGLIMRGSGTGAQLGLKFDKPKHDAFEVEWNAAVDRETKSRAIFAQHPIQKAVDEDIARELTEVALAIGGEADVERFTLTALKSLHAITGPKHPYPIDVHECSAALRDAIGQDDHFRAAFHGYAPAGTLLLTRTHPIVEGLAAHVLESALDRAIEAPAHRAGVIRTKAVLKRTTLVLARLRFHLLVRDRNNQERRLLAEDLTLAAFAGSPEAAEWLPGEGVEALLAAEPVGNLKVDSVVQHLSSILDGIDILRPKLASIAKERGKALLDAHKRVRKIAKGGSRTLGIDPHHAVDILGLYVYLPADSAGAAK